MAHWKEIHGYEGLYLISDEGEVMSLPREKRNKRGKYKTQQRILRPGKRGRGKQLYKFVVLSDENGTKHFSIHRLVAEAFIDNPNNLPEVNHKDENPFNNRVENLEWCSKQYNIEYSKGKHISQYTLDGEKLAEYRSITVASKITGVQRTAINNNLTGWSETAGGYIWRYEMEE